MPRFDLPEQADFFLGEVSERAWRLWAEVSSRPSACDAT
jgi:hypothetical protein